MEVTLEGEMSFINHLLCDTVLQILSHLILPTTQKEKYYNYLTVGKQKMRNISELPQGDPQIRIEPEFMLKFICPKITCVSFYTALTLRFKWKGSCFMPLQVSPNTILICLLVRVTNKE